MTPASVSPAPTPRPKPSQSMNPRSSDNPRATTRQASVLRHARVLVALLGVFIVAAARAATGPTADLLAHGSEDTVWVAQVIKSPAEKTAVRYRPIFEKQWQEMPRLN